MVVVEQPHWRATTGDHLLPPPLPPPLPPAPVLPRLPPTFRPVPPVPLGSVATCSLISGNACFRLARASFSWLGCGCGERTSPTPSTHQACAPCPLLQPLLGGWRPEGLSASCDSSDCVYCAALARLRQPGGSAGCWLRQKRSRSSTDLAGLGEGERPAGTSSCGAEEPCSLARVPSATTLAAVVPDAMADSLWDHALLAEVPSACGSREQQPGPPQLKRQRRRQEQQQEEPAAGAEGQATSSQPASSSSSSEGGSASEGSSRGGRASSARSHGGRASSARSHGSSSTAAAAEAGGLLPAASAWHPSWQAPSVLREVASFLPPVHHHGSRPGSSCCTDIVCALEFEEHGWLLASAGVSKQVRAQTGLLAWRQMVGAPLLWTGAAALAGGGTHPVSETHPATTPAATALHIEPHMLPSLALPQLLTGPPFLEIRRCACTRWLPGCSTPATTATCGRCAATACPPSSAAWPGTPTHPAQSPVSFACMVGLGMCGLGQVGQHCCGCALAPPLLPIGTETSLKY